MLLGRELYKKSKHKPQGCLLSFQTEQSGQLLKSHQPSTLAILVPLMEQEYNLNELCVLFIYLHVPRPFWNPLNSMT